MKFFVGKKAQSATEFVVLISFMFVVFFVFFFVIQNKIVDVSQSKDVLTLKEATSLTKTYFDLARQSYVDFKHSFVLPDIGNFDYEVSLENNDTIVSKLDDSEYVYFLPYTVKGHVLTGSSSTNVVYHLDGNISISPGTYLYDSKAEGLFVNIDAERCFYLSEIGGCNLTSDPSSIDCNNYTGIC